MTDGVRYANGPGQVAGISEGCAGVAKATGSGLPRWMIPVGAAALCAAGLGLRLYGIGDRGFWWDEIALWRAALTGEFGPHEAPVSAWLSLLSMLALGSVDSFAFHLPMIVAGSLAIVGALLLGRALGGERVGLLAAALTAFSAMAIFYSQEGRPYGLLQLMSALVLYTFIRSHQMNASRWWWLYGFCVAVACATHAIVVQTLAALGLAYVLLFFAGRLGRCVGVVDLPRLVALAVSTALGAAVGLSWLLFRTGVASAFEGISTANLSTYVRVSLTALGTGVQQQDPHSFRPVDAIAAAMFALFVVGLLRLRGRRGLAPVMALTFVVPLVVCYATLGYRADWIWFRYLAHLLVPYLVVVALGAEHVVVRFSPPGRWAARILLLVFLGPGLMWWAAKAPRDRNARHRTWASQIARMGPDLSGVIVPEIDYGYGDESARMLDIDHLYRTDDLPRYLLRSSELRRIRLEEARFGLARLPAPGRRVAELPAGSYALLDRRMPPSCELLARTLSGDVQVTRRPAQGRLAICLVQRPSPPE